MDTYQSLHLLFLGGTFLLALLTYIDRNTAKANKNAYPVGTQGRRVLV